MRAGGCKFGRGQKRGVDRKIGRVTLVINNADIAVAHHLALPWCHCHCPCRPCPCPCPYPCPCLCPCPCPWPLSALALALALGPCQPLSALVLVLALKSTLVLHRHNMFGWTRSLNHDITSYHSGSDLPQSPETKNQPPTSSQHQKVDL